MVITPQNIYLRYNAILSFAIRYPVSIAIAIAADAPLNADFFLCPLSFPKPFSHPSLIISPPILISANAPISDAAAANASSL